MKKNLKRNLFPALAAAVFLSSASCLVSCNHAGPAYDAGGTLEATSIVVSAQGNGTILWLEARQGSRVEKGNVIGCIDTMQLYLQKRMLTAGRQATLQQKPDMGKQVAATELALQQARTELSRIEKLMEGDAATRQQYTQARNAVAQLEAQLEAQKASIRSGIGSLDAQSSAQEIQIAQVQDMILKSLIASPITGTVLDQYAQAGEQAYAGRPLFKVANLEEMTLKAYITAEKLSSLRLGQAVKVYTLKDGEPTEYPGTLTYISDQAEFTPKSVQSQDERENLVYAVKISVKNDGYLKIGMYADVIFDPAP